MAVVVNGLWIEGELTALEQLTIESFCAHGFEFHLWTYSPEIGYQTKNCIIKNAEEILPKSTIFTYKHTNIFGHGRGSYAGFSDIFRYKLLYEIGGIWTDMDITCLTPFVIKDDYFFRYHHKAGAVGNFMKCPKKSELMHWCFERSIIEITYQNTNWMLPIQILNEGIVKFGLNRYIHQISNNDSFPEIINLLTSPVSIPENWRIVHWMNEEFRRMKISKDVCLPSSFLDLIYTRYKIPHTNYRGINIIKNRFLLNRYYYLWINIKSTFNFYLSLHKN